MPTRTPHPFVKAATVILAITLMSGFVFYRQQNGSAANTASPAALSVDSPETKAAQQQVHIDSLYFDQSLPSSKSGMIVPPDHPAFQQQRLDTPRSSATERRAVLPTSKSGPVFEPASMVNDSALKDAKAQDTLK